MVMPSRSELKLNIMSLNPSFSLPMMLEQGTFVFLKMIIAVSLILWP